MTWHCFQVASSCILPSIMCTPRPSGIASMTLRGEARPRPGRGRRPSWRSSICTGCSDQAPTQPIRNAARNWASQPVDVLDVAERPVEREDPGRRAGVDHAPDRVVPEVLLGASRAAPRGLAGPGRRARGSRGGRRRRASSSSAARRRGRPGRSSCPACAGWRAAISSTFATPSAVSRIAWTRIGRSQPGARLELGQQAVDVVDVPRPLDLRDHDHVEPVADLGDQRA